MPTGQIKKAANVLQEAVAAAVSTAPAMTAEAATAATAATAVAAEVLAAAEPDEVSNQFSDRTFKRTSSKARAVAISVIFGAVYNFVIAMVL